MSAVAWDVAPARRTRHTPAEVTARAEVAARTLARLYSPGCAWEAIIVANDFGMADVFNMDGERDDTPCELRGAFRVFTRGTKTMRKTADVDGVPGLRYHNASGAAVTLRSRRCEEVSGALSFARLAPIPQALLLTYSGDYSQWASARAALCSLRPGEQWAAAVDDAGNRLIFAKAVMPAAARALKLRMRKENVLAMRRDAERILIGWLDSASRAFLAALKAGTAIPAEST